MANLYSMKLNEFSALIPVLILALGCSPRSGADIILTGGTILSMDKYLAPAEALAIVDGRILAVGWTNEIISLANWRTKRIDLKGAVVIPGLTDSHFHLRSFGRSLGELDVTGTASAEEVAHQVAAQAQKVLSGGWIRGRGWDQNDWQVREFPTRQPLDKVAPNHPVLLTRVDGHAIWVNSKALELAGITANTSDPEGGAIIRDALNQPTGILIDNAADLVKDIIPQPTKTEIRRWLLAAVKRCNQVGLTGLHDAGVDPTTLEVLLELADEGLLTLRYYGMLDGSDEILLQTYFNRGPLLNYGGYVTARAVKFYADGALGSRGAALLKSYSDDPGNRGLLVTPPEELESLVARTLEAGFQPCIHAIGDRANQVVLDIYERTLTQHPGSDLRPRIEHAQVIAPRDIRRFARLGVIPAMQPSHATSDMYWAEERLGPERIKGAYAWRQLLSTDVIIPGGSDCPVEREEPLLQLYAARTRQNTDSWPPGGWYPDERMAGLEALKALTSWAAYAAFQESTHGRILPGYQADLTVLSVNPVTCDPGALLDAKVLMTMINGRIVWYDKKGFRQIRARKSHRTASPPSSSEDER